LNLVSFPGQLNSLLKNVKSDRTPLLKRYITIPILLSPERDETLAKMTDNRVGAFSHDLVINFDSFIEQIVFNAMII
jgi:mediator of RNA polymerase II transcription subunit 8